MTMLGLIAAVALAAAAQETGRQEAPVTTRGVGALRIGMPGSALRRLGAEPAEAPETPGGCHYWRVRTGDRIRLMVVGDRLVRIDITNPAYRTWSGAGVGMTEAEIRRIYGRALRVRPHPYDRGRYLTYHRDGDPFGLIIETDPDNRAAMMRVGYWRNVQWIEGCL